MIDGRKTEIGSMHYALITDTHTLCGKKLRKLYTDLEIKKKYTEDLNKWTVQKGRVTCPVCNRFLGKEKSCKS